MTTESPSVYILYGEHEFGIEDFLNNRLKPKMGGSANAEMNITTLDGSSAVLEEIRAETHAMPFLTERRMVIIDHPLAAAKGKNQQQKFLALLESVPASTACVLLINRDLKDSHWLLSWAGNHPRQAWKRSFALPRGRAMSRWIQDQAAARGGEFTPRAAQLLASYLDEDPRLAALEIEKLLTYVDFSRSVTAEDVQKLTADVRQGDVFRMVDAIGTGDGETASRMLHRLLDEKDPLPLFGMIVRQFRLLIQVREILNTHPSRDHNAIADQLDQHPYPIKKILPQARQFTLEQLRTIYQQLSEVDQAMKTGALDGELALDLLIAALTQPAQTEKKYA